MVASRAGDDARPTAPLPVRHKLHSSPWQALTIVGRDLRFRARPPLLSLLSPASGAQRLCYSLFCQLSVADVSAFAVPASRECCVLRSASCAQQVRLCTCHPPSALLKPGHMCVAQGASEAAPRTRRGALSLQLQQFRINPFASLMQGQTKASRLRASSKPGPQSATSANEDGIAKSRPLLRLTISGFSVGVLPEHAKMGYRPNKRNDGAV